VAVYLDHNATTPLDPRVLEAMLPYLGELYGNPSSRHRFGRLARAALDAAREQVAALVGAQPGQVVFTSGGTESNTGALLGVTQAEVAGRIAISAVEHASLRAAAGLAERAGWGVDTLAVDGEGRVEIGAAEDLLGPRTRLVSVMAANNETGVLQDVPAIAARARAQGALMHCDAAQAAGKIPVDLRASGAHLMSLSAHKLYGPKGVGALVVDRAVDLAPLLPGGGQERGLRGGTENLAAIVGFGAAAELAAAELDARRDYALGLRERLEAGLAGLPGVQVLGEGAERLPNTTLFTVAGMQGETLLMQLDRKGLAVSSGSACASGSTEPSHVLTAMGVPADLARGAVRVSLGQGNSAADVDRLLAELERMTGMSTSHLPNSGVLRAAAGT
jgi:cysteine desulfurase